MNAMSVGLRWTTSVVAGGLLIGAAAVAQDEMAMSLEDAPEGALSAAQAAAPHVTFETVGIEVEEGVTTYEFGGSAADGRTFEVDVAQWFVLEIEEPVTIDAVPAAVMELVEIQMPGFAPTMIERSAHSDGVVVYEFEGMNDAGEEVDIEVQADGESIVVMADDET